MSDSNVGSRKKRSCINHIFVINGIIHETLSSKHNKPVTLQIYDSGVKDDTLALLYEANKNIKVGAPYKLSAEQSFQNLVLQVDTWGPIMISNQVDTIGKQLLMKNPNISLNTKVISPSKFLVWTWYTT